jgi:hypothetical protein
MLKGRDDFRTGVHYDNWRDWVEVEVEWRYVASENEDINFLYSLGSCAVSQQDRVRTVARCTAGRCAI